MPCATESSTRRRRSAARAASRAISSRNWGRLRKENAELKRANEILKAASAHFAKELDRPRTR